MRVILVPVADRPECANALTTAFDLAERLRANVAGYHVRPHRAEKRRGVHAIPFILRTTSDWQKFLSDDEIRLDSKAAQKFFMRLVEMHGFTFTKHARHSDTGGLALWHEMMGSPEKVFSIVGPVSDLLVVSRPKRKASARARSFLMSALMCSGRPVLMLPQRKLKQVGTRILIAWNQSAEAAAAVTAALPLLRCAQSVTILSAGSESRVGPKSSHLQQYLKHSNIKAKRVRTRGADPELELDDTFRETESDLLIMGAYSRGHWRETIFGGMTDHVLNHTSLPTLMLHR